MNAATAAQGRTALIAVAIPSDGRYAAAGQAILEGAKSAGAKLNRAGGVNGATIAVRHFEAGCGADFGVSDLSRVIDAEPALVVGHPCDRGAIAAARAYAKSKIIFVSTGVRHRDLTQKRAGRTIFRLAGRDDRQGDAAGRYLARVYRGGQIALVHDRTAFARRLVKGVQRALQRDKGSPSAFELGIVAGETSYLRVVDKLRARGVGAIYFAGFAAEAEILFRELLQAGLRVPFVGPDVLAVAQLEAIADGIKEAKIFLTQAHKARVTARSDRGGVAASHKVAQLPGVGMAHAAVEVWATAAERAGSMEGGAISAAMASGSTNTVIGPVKFDKRGDAVMPSYDMTERRNGTWVRLVAPPVKN